jgi:hypothetical protein
MSSDLMNYLWFGLRKPWLWVESVDTARMRMGRGVKREVQRVLAILAFPVKLIEWDSYTNSNAYKLVWRSIGREGPDYLLAGRQLKSTLICYKPTDEEIGFESPGMLFLFMLPDRRSNN